MAQARRQLKAFLLGFSLFIAPFGAAHAADAPGRSISVQGRAEERVTPDQAVVTVGLASKNRLLVDAKRQNDALAAKFIALAKEFKIAEADIATSQLTINPEYDYSPKPEGSPPKLIGFNVQRTLTLTLRQLSAYEQFIGKLVEAGVDQLQGVQFAVSTPDARLDALRLKAYTDAKTKADALAKVAGVALGKPISITAQGASAPPPMPMVRMAKSMAMDAGAPPPLPGAEVLSQSVDVVFEVQ